MTTKDLPSDRIYAKALSKTLTKVASPLTVGLYSSCNSRINMVLRNIEIEMEREAERREKKSQGRSKPRPVQTSLCSTLALIFRLLFYRPVWTEYNQDQKNVRFVFVRFSAWHFAGSDLLWAGLVMRLCVVLQEKFGKLQLGLYRMAQHDEEVVEHKKAIEDSTANWRSKKFCCFPLWLLLALVVTGAVIILALLIMFGFPKSEVEEAESTEGEESAGFGVLEGFAIATLGVPAAGAVRFTFMLGKNLVFNQDLNIRRSMDNQKMSEQLGFMNEVRKEMRLLSSFIHFMEIFERRKIRVVLEITNLDRCTPRKIVGVLDAVNILLSDEESPFISLLAVDPEVLAEQVNNAESCYGQKDQAFSFLDRIITLPFTVPPLCDKSKREVFSNIVCGQSEIPEVFPQKDEEKPMLLESPKSSMSLEDDSLFNGKGLLEETSVPLTAQPHQAQGLKEEEMEWVIQDAFKSVLQPNISPLHEYISGDTMSMRRVINSIRVTVVIMEELAHFQLPPSKRVAAWVVLADRWPCRLSWILQCIEDAQQRTEIDQEAGMGSVHMDSSVTLWQVFRQHRLELHLMKEEVDNLLERDGDPELFEKFLKVDFIFTVSEAERFEQSTVNLDHSIKRELARLRGSTRLKDPTWKNTFNALPKRQVINMSPEDICKEMSRVGLPDKYAEAVKSNHLNGRALLFNDPVDLKEVLQMTLGEWTTFKITFLTDDSSAGGHDESRPALTQPTMTLCPSSPLHAAACKTSNV
ncbi:NTPase KAP family P-loop domain-containing protein 1 [Clupea harengus]|uniref:NTPase KAP family P-loop domain-containing protein 1 n=1 Tax=Clupea harengus TaxID=7950 RepID=A0A6P8ERW7_CLUHA|nr:NTPase KAP family P-loop domain-containing protein 1 [Clupea harengus]